MSNDISKTAVVTGASRGIGRAIALMLAEKGYNLILTARNKEKLEETAALCEKFGVPCELRIADIAEETDIINLFSDIKHLDLLVNNAGIGIFDHIENIKLDDWNKVLSTNLTGTFLCTREAFKIMKQQRSGTIINIASVVGIKGYPNQGAYSASKHGVVGLTKVLAEEGREHGIRAHVICPGGVATEMVLDARPDIPADELIAPEDVANLVKYFIELPDNVTVDLVHLRRFSSSSF